MSCGSLIHTVGSYYLEHSALQTDTSCQLDAGRNGSESVNFPVGLAHGGEPQYLYYTEGLFGHRIMRISIETGELEPFVGRYVTAQ